MKSKQATLLWLEGFREACCLHRVVIYCRRSRELMIRTGQCFLLNGLIFLGSIFIVKSVIIPVLAWILPGQCSEIYDQDPCSHERTLKFYALLRGGLVQLFYVAWFYPLYMFSFILSAIWYNDIAKHGLFAIFEYGVTVAESPNQLDSKAVQNKSQTGKPIDLEGILIGVGEQVYSLLLLTFFFFQVYVSGFIPLVGKAFSFLLLSWMYAYYCFEYKWNYSGLSLDKRLDFFESNWAFFAGFGCPCILATFFLSPLVSYGVMAILYPLFVLTATGSEADKIIALPRRKWKGAGLGRVPVFSAADYLSLRALSLFPSLCNWLTRSKSK